MKRAFLIVLILILSIMLFAGCNEYEASTTTDKDGLTSLEPVMKKIGNLQLSVDPRIELLVSVQLGSGYNLLLDSDFKYRKDMAGFIDNNNHSVINSFKSLSKTGFTYDAPLTAALYFNYPLLLEQHTDFTSYLINRAGGEKKINAFFDSLQDFCITSDFDAFYNEHNDYYNRVIDSVYENMEDTDLVNDLESYYKSKKDEYNIILSPLLQGGYGPQIKTSDGSLKVYGIIGPEKIDEDGMPVFSTEFIRYLVWHEFSHSFVNPLTEKNIEEVNQYSSLYQPISLLMKQQAYDNWDICVNEHIVRAVTTRLTYLNDGEEAGAKVMQYEKSRGFLYIEALCEKLEYYEENQDKYSSFEEFYPELILVLKDLSEKKLGEDFYSIPFEGPINAAFTDKDRVVLVVPTHEEDEKNNTNIRQYVEELRNAFFQGSKIYTDDDALKEDLSEKSIIAFGTIQGNSWLTRNSSGFPFTVEADKIIADKVYEGEGLKFITALPNPQSPLYGLVIYTAQKAGDIVNMNNVFHGPTDYILFKSDKEVITQGNYNKSDAEWNFITGE